MNYKLYIHEGLRDDNIKLKAINSYLNEENINSNYHIEKGEKGKPYIVFDDCSIDPPKFNVSHSGNFWIMIIGKDNCSVDIECVRQNYDYSKVTSRHYAKNEQSYVAKYGLNGFYRLWVRKEGLAKYMGESIFSVLPELVDDNTELIDNFKLKTIEGEKMPANIKDIDICDGTFCSIITPEPDDSISFERF